MFTIGVFAVIFDEQNRVLLCHRRDMDMWNLPGGGVESCELPTEAIAREVKEETGLSVEIERLVEVVGKSYRDELVFVFTCRVVGGKLTTTDESDDCRYFALDQFPPNTLSAHWARVTHALENAAPVFYRQTEPSLRK
jgi:8-oxo-dGTP diphosphatase